MEHYRDQSNFEQPQDLESEQARLFDTLGQLALCRLLSRLGATQDLPPPQRQPEAQSDMVVFDVVLEEDALEKERRRAEQQIVADYPASAFRDRLIDASNAAYARKRKRIFGDH